MNDKELFAAQTQRHITLLLLYGLLALVAVLIVASFLPFKVDTTILSLANPLITGVYGLTSGAVGFWIAKQRYQSIDNGNGDGAAPPHAPLASDPPQEKKS
jgi:hypothetical protein